MRPRAAGGDPPSNPLYKEVKNRLMRGLVAGEWKPGQALPSEWRLAGRYGVSVGTVRRAVDELVAEKIVRRRQGSGTYVTTHTEDHQLYYFFHIIGKDGGRRGSPRVVRKRFRLRLWTPAQWRHRLREAGLRLLRAYGDFRGSRFRRDSPRLLLLAERPRRAGRRRASR